MRSTFYYRRPSPNRTRSFPPCRLRYANRIPAHQFLLMGRALFYPAACLSVAAVNAGPTGMRRLHSNWQSCQCRHQPGPAAVGETDMLRLQPRRHAAPRQLDECFGILLRCAVELVLKVLAQPQYWRSGLRLLLRSQQQAKQYHHCVAGTDGFRARPVVRRRYGLHSEAIPNNPGTVSV